MTDVEKKLAKLEHEIEAIKVTLTAFDRRTDSVSDKVSGVNGLTDRLDDLRIQVGDVMRSNARVEKATREVTKLFDDKSVQAALERAETISQLYQGNMAQLTTMEMVIHALWRLPEAKRPVSIGTAASKLVRLMGHGPEYFLQRESWTLFDWMHHLSRVTEKDMPILSQGDLHVAA